MRNYFTLGLLTAISIVSACNYSGTPVEYANVCDKANDDKLVEVVGFLDNKGSAMCSSGYGHPMRCPIGFKDNLDSEKSLNASIDKGTGASSIDEYEKGKGLKLKDAMGEFVERTQKVKIVAEVNVFDEASRVGDPNSAACYLIVKKIEKQ
jgi:hypothetical protein